MKLSSRLLFVTRFIEKDMVIADIGSDHGFLPFYLLENNLITKAYACDNKIGPYNNLKKTFADYFPDKIELALNDGLNNLPSYVNCVIMTGMGGDLIIKLLSRDHQYLNNVNYLILSPQSNIPLVREYVSNNGFKIIDEGLVEDDKIYTSCLNFEQMSLNSVKHFPIFKIVFFITFVDWAKNPAWVADSNHVCRNVFCYNASSTNHSIVADCYIWSNHGVIANINV